LLDASSYPTEFSTSGLPKALQRGSLASSPRATPRAEFGEAQYANGIVTVHYVGAASMPLLPSPDVDVNGSFSVNVETGEVSFHGNVDVYPWYEVYATVNNGAPVALVQAAPTGTPEGLIGGASVPVSGTANALGH